MIDATEFAAAAAALDELDQAAAPALEHAVRTMADATADHIHQAAARHRRTGAMERAIGVRVTGHGTGTVATVTAGGPTAHLIVGGVRPHVIRAHGRALPIGLAGGVQSFREAVRHPGFRADPFVARGIEAAQADIDAATAKAGDAIAGDLIARIDRRR